MKKKILSLILVLFVVGGGYEVLPKVINPFQTTVCAATVTTGAYRVSGPFTLYVYEYMSYPAFPGGNRGEWVKTSIKHNYKVGEVITPIYNSKKGQWVDSKTGCNLKDAPQCYLTKLY